MKLLSICCALCCLLQLRSQDRPFGRNFEFGLMISPEFATGIRGLSNRDRLMFVGEVEPNVKPLPYSYAAGLLFRLPLRGTFSFQTGMQYTRMGYRIYQERSHSNPDPLAFKKTYSTYHYLGVPLKLIWSPESQKTTSMQFSAALNVNRMVGKVRKTNYTFEDEIVKTTDRPRSYWNINPCLGWGIQKEFNENNKLLIETVFQLGLLPVNYSSPRHLMNLGLNVAWFHNL